MFISLDSSREEKGGLVYLVCVYITTKRGIIRVFVDTVSKINTYTILYSNFSGPCYTLYISKDD